MRAILIEKDGVALKDIPESALPEGDVTVAIEYSTLNYKDGLALTGAAPVVRKFPMIPGVDFAGTVTASAHGDFKPGDKVILNSWGVGELHWGGLAQQARVKGDWLIPLPSAFTTRQAMAIGTAGYTAMLCILVLEAHGVSPQNGEVAVSGASGGVGSVAIAVLAKLGYTVAAITGKPQEEAYLKGLGASVILDRHELPAVPKPLEKERWAGAVDTVGGVVLSALCAQMRYHGVIAACGLAGGAAFAGNVMPFILRGVMLAGVESVYVPKEQRIVAWNRLARDLELRHVESMMHEIGLEDALKLAPDLIAGKRHGRIVVNVNR
ncbi:MAG: oxidoreductase [Alphaproteobacteria bacterium]|nr:oxidoreductase [Alphaproteobacteria bacterium]